jgi:hypothetical protein
MSVSLFGRSSAPISALAAGLALMTIAAPAGAQNIDTRTGAPFSAAFSVEHLNTGSTPPLYRVISWGQTFTAPVAGSTNLSSFSFFLNNGGHTTANEFSFRGFLAAWDAAANTVVGDLLWTSASRTGSTAPQDANGDGVMDFEEYAFNTGGLNLSAGQMYYAFLSSANDLDPAQEPGIYGNGAQAVYGFDATGQTGGAYVLGGAVGWTMDTDGSAPLTGEQLRNGATFRNETSNYDMGFTATFATANGGGQTPPPTDMPEPGSLAMLVAGLVGIRKATRRRA